MESPTKNRHPDRFKQLDAFYLEPESEINKIPTSVKSKIRNSTYFTNNNLIIYSTDDHTVKPTTKSLSLSKPQIISRPSNIDISDKKKN